MNQVHLKKTDAMQNPQSPLIAGSVFSYYAIVQIIRSLYAFCANNPVNAIDADGRIIIFVNGMHNGTGGTRKYWAGFDNIVMQHLKDNKTRYYDGAFGGGLLGVYGKTSSGFTYSNVNPDTRYEAGYAAGKRDASSIQAQLVDGETIKVISHSMGAAYAKGLVQAIIDAGVDPSRFAFEADFAPFQPKAQKTVEGVNTLQFSHTKDRIAGDDKIPGAIFFDTKTDPQQTHFLSDFNNQILNLPQGNYKVIDNQIIPF